MGMDAGSYYDSELLQESTDEVEDKIPEWRLCVTGLTNADAKMQEEAAKKLRSQVDATARQLSTEQFDKWEDEVHARVFNLLNGKVCAAAVAYRGGGGGKLLLVSSVT